MRKLAPFALGLLLCASTAVAAQLAPPPEKGKADAVQHGAQPNPDEIRPGNRDGDAPSAAAGEVIREPQRRILGFPVNSALAIAGVLVVLLVVAGIVIPSAGRRYRARGGGTYGRH